MVSRFVAANAAQVAGFHAEIAAVISEEQGCQEQGCGKHLFHAVNVTRLTQMNSDVVNDYTLSYEISRTSNGEVVGMQISRHSAEDLQAAIDAGTLTIDEHGTLTWSE